MLKANEKLNLKNTMDIIMGLLIDISAEICCPEVDRSKNKGNSLIIDPQGSLTM